MKTPAAYSPSLVHHAAMKARMVEEIAALPGRAR